MPYPYNPKINININSPLDDSGYLVGIDIIHHEIHEGNHYSTSYYEKIGSGTAINVLITVGTKSIHMVGEMVSDNPGMATFSKSPNATTTSSTAITCFNNNGNSSKTTDTVFTVGGTYTSSGTILRTYLFGSSSGTGGNKISMGSTAGEINEAILTPGDKYLIRFVADGASTRTIIRTAFYEQDW
jgi:hypothetical protein